MHFTVLFLLCSVLVLCECNLQSATVKFVNTMFYSIHINICMRRYNTINTALGYMY